MVSHSQYLDIFRQWENPTKILKLILMKTDWIPNTYMHHLHWLLLAHTLYTHKGRHIIVPMYVCSAHSTVWVSVWLYVYISQSVFFVLFCLFVTPPKIYACTNERICVHKCCAFVFKMHHSRTAHNTKCEWSLVEAVVLVSVETNCACFLEWRSHIIYTSLTHPYEEHTWATRVISQ